MVRIIPTYLFCNILKKIFGPTYRFESINYHHQSIDLTKTKKLEREKKQEPSFLIENLLR